MHSPGWSEAWGGTGRDAHYTERGSEQGQDALATFGGQDAHTFLTGVRLLQGCGDSLEVFHAFGGELFSIIGELSPDGTGSVDLLEVGVE